MKEKTIEEVVRRNDYIAVAIYLAAVAVLIVVMVIAWFCPVPSFLNRL